MNAQGIIGSEMFLDAEMNCYYAIDKYSQIYGEIVSCFRNLAKDKILQPYFTQKDFVTLVIIYMFLIYVIIKIIVLLNLSK